MIRKKYLIGLITIGLLLVGIGGYGEKNNPYDSRGRLVDKNGRPLRTEADNYPYLNKFDHLNYLEGYEDGSVRPNKEISREEVSAVIYRLLNDGYKGKTNIKASKFKDIEDDRWSRVYIETLTKNGILKGYKDGSFKPRNPITRGELAVLIGRMEGINTGTVNKFNDVSNHWARDAINTSAKKGWLKGYDDGSFKPDKEVTRAEFVSFMNRVLKRNVDRDGILKGIKEFTDLEEDKWYYLPMVEALNSHTYRRLFNEKEAWNKIIK